MSGASLLVSEEDFPRIEQASARVAELLSRSPDPVALDPDVVSCTWCGLESPPGAVCGICGSPLVGELHFRVGSSDVTVVTDGRPRRPATGAPRKGAGPSGEGSRRAPGVSEEAGDEDEFQFPRTPRRPWLHEPAAPAVETPDVAQAEAVVEDPEVEEPDPPVVLVEDVTAVQDEIAEVLEMPATLEKTTEAPAVETPSAVDDDMPVLDILPAASVTLEPEATVDVEPAVRVQDPPPSVEWPDSGEIRPEPEYEAEAEAETAVGAILDLVAEPEVEAAVRHVVTPAEPLVEAPREVVVEEPEMPVVEEPELVVAEAIVELIETDEAGTEPVASIASAADGEASGDSSRPGAGATDVYPASQVDDEMAALAGADSGPTTAETSTIEEAEDAVASPVLDWPLDLEMEAGWYSLEGEEHTAALAELALLAGHSDGEHATDREEPAQTRPDVVDRHEAPDADRDDMFGGGGSPRALPTGDGLDPAPAYRAPDDEVSRMAAMELADLLGQSPSLSGDLEMGIGRVAEDDAGAPTAGAREPALAPSASAATGSRGDGASVAAAAPVPHDDSRFACSRCRQPSLEPLCEACQEAFNLLKSFSVSDW